MWLPRRYSLVAGPVSIRYAQCLSAHSTAGLFARLPARPKSIAVSLTPTALNGRFAASLWPNPENKAYAKWAISRITHRTSSLASP